MPLLHGAGTLDQGASVGQAQMSLCEGGGAGTGQ